MKKESIDRLILRYIHKKDDQEKALEVNKWAFIFIDHFKKKLYEHAYKTYEKWTRKKN